MSIHVPVAMGMLKHIFAWLRNLAERPSYSYGRRSVCESLGLNITKSATEATKYRHPQSRVYLIQDSRQ